MRLPFLLLTISMSALRAQPSPRTLGLREAMQAAEKLSPDVQLANLRALEGEAVTRNVRSGYQPQAGVSISGGYQAINLQNIGLFLPGFSARTGPFRTFDARPRLTQTVIDLSLLSSIHASREKERELRFDAETRREATLLAVLQIYLQAQQAESRIRATEARRKTAKAVLEQARQFEQAGTASKLDVARAEQQFETESTGVIEARRDRSTLITALLRTIGMPQEDVTLEPVPQPGKLPAPVERPELRAIAARIRSAALDKQRAGRERLPKLAFTGDYGVAGNGPDRSLSTFGIGATLTIPIWTGGRIEADIQGAKIREEMAQTQRRNIELQIAQEARQAEIDAGAALEALRCAARAASAAREALELARLRFASGIATNLDTITAQGTLAQAEDYEIRIRYDFLLARARLARARGNVYAFLE
ncbi:MAG: TolC family protein [Bryobacterales bacterium]|nr:TolC family protein [Bryobacterales bacterium]